ncbi:MAG: CPBP family intramembrane metalloprotease [Verrucomicrobiota bacterium]|nr:CPBP family intramembrane metalloprotease [Verrucomicrobiota bacterium]
MKDAARLLIYFAATLLFGALIAPLLYWTAHRFGVLTQFDFGTFFHRALLIGALIFFWPLFRSLGINSWRELALRENPHRMRDVVIGFAAAAIPLLCFGGLIIGLGIYQLRDSISFMAIAGRSVSALIVPLIEEPLFRGLILGVLLRASSRNVAVFFTSALFAILHFLKAPEKTSSVVHWNSGFLSIANSFSQFADPLLLAAGFTTLFLLGWILADARIRTGSLWLPIGLHAGWIFSSALFNKIAHREVEALPWLGKSLLIGLAPLAVALVTWALITLWLKHEHRAA